MVDDAGRGEMYLSIFNDGRLVEGPRLARPDEVPRERIVVTEVAERENVALACARRAAAIVASGRLDDYRDVTPIYVRLAEAEVKLRQKQK